LWRKLTLPDLLNPNIDALDDSHDSPSLDTLAARRKRKAETNAQILHSAAATASEKAAESVAVEPLGPADTVNPGAAELEEEAEGEGAFNPETGEINWDCPCLGGMAHGPCGPQFREAFSCFVYSNEEPKGMDCIEKFQSMRDCFSEHPDVYKDELMEDEEIDRELEAEKAELTQQIAERQKAEQTSGRRLLEEAPAEPRTPNPPKKTKNKSSSEGNTSTSDQGATEATPTIGPSNKDKLPEAAYSAVNASNQTPPNTTQS
jgi:mitochondrial intermembrane space import and assembly protein 40